MDKREGKQVSQKALSFRISKVLIFVDSIFIDSIFILFPIPLLLLLFPL